MVHKKNLLAHNGIRIRKLCVFLFERLYAFIYFALKKKDKEEARNFVIQ